MARLPRQPRTATKGTGAPRHPPEVRARALEVYERDGLATAHRETGVPKPTIARWAREGEVTHDAGAALAQTKAATETSLARRAAHMAAVREQLVSAQATIALTASALEVDVLALQRDAVKEARASEVGAVSAATLNRLQVLNAGPRLSEIVGAKTRAIHDLLLLEGQATEHTASRVAVHFATGEPAATAGPVEVYELDDDGGDDDAEG